MKSTRVTKRRSASIQSDLYKTKYSDNKTMHTDHNMSTMLELMLTYRSSKDFLLYSVDRPRDTAAEENTCNRNSMDNME